MTGLVTPLIVAAAAAYLVAFALLLAGRLRAGFAAFGAAWCVNAGLWCLNWIAGGEPPFANMYHVQVFLSACFLPLYVALAKKERLAWIHVYFAFAAAMPLIGALFMERQVLWRRMPALQSPWFVPHVFAYMVSYSLAAVAFALTVAGAVRGRRVGGSGGGTPGPAAAPRDYAEASCQTMRLAFPFMTFGLLSGAIWADEAWGVYWSWDPKETWSLITWTLYLVYFHLRRRAGARRLAAAAQVLAFLALLTTFLLVNLLPRLASALHSYAR